MSGSHSECHFLLLICEHFAIFVIYPWSLKGNSDCHIFVFFHNMVQQFN